MKKTIKINENELMNIIKKTINEVSEFGYPDWYQTKNLLSLRKANGLTETNLRTIAESTYRGVVNECMNKKIEEQRELVHSIVSEMVHRCVNEGIKLREEDIPDDDFDDDTPTPEEAAEERAESDRYFKQFAHPQPEEEHQEGDVIDYDGFKIEKKNGVYVFVLSDKPKSIIYSNSLNKLEQNLDYIFDTVDPKERAKKMKEYTGTPYLCRTHFPEGMMVGGEGETPELGFEINLDGFDINNKWARKSREERRMEM